jgi:Fe-S oxidoreductase
MSFMDCCDWDACTECGECLMKCPVMLMNEDEAKSEIAALLKGKPARRVFRECSLCFDCNNFCPEGLRPHELILQRISEKPDRKNKIPAMVPYFFNGMPGPNLFQDLYKGLTPPENDILKRWSEVPPPSKDVLFIGCIGKMFTEDIENSKVLKPLPKFGPPDICCGEIHYRSGQWDAYADMTERTFARLSELDAERIICYCGSCNAFLGKIMPKVYGKELPFKVTSLYQWLLERVDAGEIQLKRPLKFKAAVHESCYASELGPEFTDSLRKIYKAAGADLVELFHHGNNNTSCGAVSIVRNWSISDVVKEQNKKYREVKDSGTNEMALNCPGCYLTMASSNWAHKIKLRYMPEQLLRAYGDEIKKPISKLVWPFTKTIAMKTPLAIKKINPVLPRIPVK